MVEPIGPEPHDPAAEAEKRFADGIACHKAGRPAEAERLYDEVLALAPQHAGALYLSGLCAAQSGRPDAAIDRYERALRLVPDYPVALNNLGIALQERGRLDEAIERYRQALRLVPDDADILNNLGSALQEQGRPDEAIGHYQKALRLRPGEAGLHNNLGTALQERGRPDEAIGHYRKALRLVPDSVEALANLGTALKEQGRLGEAMAVYDRTLAIRPDHAETLLNRADLKRFRADDPDLAVLESLVAGAGRLPDDQAMFLHFALGKALEDAGDPPRAFEQFLKGNALKRRRLTYDEAATATLFERIAGCFDDALFRRLHGSGDPSRRPIFVLGMPRSGSTLVEQILASHPLVSGGGELVTLPALVTGQPTPYPDFVPGLEPEALAGLGRTYLAGLPEMPPDSTSITDKMPGNFLYLGLIRLILPRARIIHTVRDPVDTCLSCFSKLFVDRQEFSYELGELGRYYRRYRTLMEHWRAVLPPDSFLDVRYEAVVADLEAEARRLIAWCGLPWDDRCLEFHRTPRTIRTASSAQVRQPVFHSALDHGRRYREYLAPLLDELGAESRPKDLP